MTGKSKFLNGYINKKLIKCISLFTIWVYCIDIVLKTNLAKMHCTALVLLFLAFFVPGYQIPDSFMYLCITLQVNLLSETYGYIAYWYGLLLDPVFFASTDAM